MPKKRAVQKSAGVHIATTSPDAIKMPVNAFLNLTLKDLGVDRYDAAQHILEVSKTVLALPGTDCLWLFLDSEETPDLKIMVEKDDTEATVKSKLRAAIEEGGTYIRDFGW